MFFRRNRKKDKASRKKGVEGPSYEEKRRCYRKQKVRAQPLTVSLKLPTGKTVQGEFVDLSVGGAGARFHLANDPAIAPNEVVEITIGSLTRRECVTTPARIVYAHQEDDGAFLKYGFEFINVGNLYSQLDEFYSRFFNRRRSVRVRMALDRKVKVDMRWSEVNVKATMHDISLMGLGVAMSQEDYSRLREADGVNVTFRLPRTDVDIEGRLIPRNKKELSKQVLVGYEFDLTGPAGFARHKDLINAYILRRRDEMAKWDVAAA